MLTACVCYHIVGWAVDKIKQIWDDVKGLIANVKNFLGGRRLEEIDATNLPELKAAIQEDFTLSELDRMELLSMVAQVEAIQARSNLLYEKGRRRMRDEMDEHRRRLEDGLARHHAHRRRMEVSSQESTAKTCSQAHRPLEIASAHLALSLPFKATIEIEPHDIKVSKDLMKELGVKPKKIPVKFERSMTLPIIPVR